MTDCEHPDDRRIRTREHQEDLVESAYNYATDAIISRHVASHRWVSRCDACGERWTDERWERCECRAPEREEMS